VQLGRRREGAGGAEQHEQPGQGGEMSQDRALPPSIA
jgi:hypothetical protein